MRRQILYISVCVLQCPRYLPRRDRQRRRWARPHPTALGAARWVEAESTRPGGSEDLLYPLRSARASLCSSDRQGTGSTAPSTYCMYLIAPPSACCPGHGSRRFQTLISRTANNRGHGWAPHRSQPPRGPDTSRCFESARDDRTSSRAPCPSKPRPGPSDEEADHTDPSVNQQRSIRDPRDPAIAPSINQSIPRTQETHTGWTSSILLPPSPSSLVLPLSLSPSPFPSRAARHTPYAELLFQPSHREAHDEALRAGWKCLRDGVSVSLCCPLIIPRSPLIACQVGPHVRPPLDLRALLVTSQKYAGDGRAAC